MLNDQIAKDLKDAMRARDDVRRRTLRSLRAALMEAEIGAREGGTGGTLSEDEELRILQRQAKQRRDAMEQFEKAGRADLAQKEEDELNVIKSYLPQPLTDEEMRQVLHEIITEVRARGPEDMGKVMGQAMQRLRGRAQGHRVQAQVKDILSGLGSDPESSDPNEA